MRERRMVKEHGVEIEVLDGHHASVEHWQAFSRFYHATFDKHWGYATLNEGFFSHLGKTMPENIVLVMAKHQGEYVAAALSLRSNDTLYGRHWGCSGRAQGGAWLRARPHLVMPLAGPPAIFLRGKRLPAA